MLNSTDVSVDGGIGSGEHPSVEDPLACFERCGVSGGVSGGISGGVSGGVFTLASIAGREQLESECREL